MNQTQAIELYAGGLGSGCRGDHCGRPSLATKITTGKEASKLAEELYDWKYTKVDARIRSAAKILNGMMRGQLVNFRMGRDHHDVAVFKHEGKTSAVLTYKVIGKRMIVEGLLAHPKLLGKEEMQRVFLGVKQYAKSIPKVSHIEFERMRVDPKDSRGALKLGKTHRIKAQVIL